MSQPVTPVDSVWPVVTFGSTSPPAISYSGYTGDSIQSDINDIEAIKLQIDDEPKITSSTESKQDTSGDYVTTAQNAVNEAQEAYNNVVVMMSIICGTGDGIIDKKTEILTQKLTTPPRVHVKELSNRRGEYPTILRTGDIDRWGNFNVSFDDENVVFFNKYPKPIVQIPLLGQNTYTGNVIPDQLIVYNDSNDSFSPTLSTTDVPSWSTDIPFDSAEYPSATFTAVDLPGGASYIDIGGASTWNNLIGTGGTGETTISIWVYPRDYGPEALGLGRIFEFGHYDITLFMRDTGQLKFTSFITPENSDPMYVAWQTDLSVLQLNTWSHISVSFELSENNPIIAINGKKVNCSTVDASSGSEFYIYNNVCKLGNHSGADRGFNGLLLNFAVWDKKLPVNIIKDIYDNNLTWLTKLGIFHYPSNLLDNDLKRLRNWSDWHPSYHDPEIHDDHLHENYGILSFGNITKGIGDETFDIYTPGEDISAFSDNPNKIGTSDFYMTGTDENVYPGFTSPLKSKTSFTIDITPEEEHVLARCPAEWMSGSTSTASDPRLHLPDSATEGPHSGFAYFTFCENIWEDVGIIDYVDSSTPHTHKILAQRTDYTDLFTGLIHNPSQFIPANDLRAKYSADIEEYSDAKFFASPTMSHDAPNNTKYFAKQAQEFTLPISSPFLLEKISLNVPISYFNTYDKRNVQSCIKTIDSLVFFLYHQRTSVGHEISSLLDVETYQNVITGSVRTLIASGSASFWQKTRSYQPDSGDVLDNTIELHHSPSFNYDWSADYPLTRGSGDDDVTDFEKDLNVEIEMIPAVSQNAYKSRNKYPAQRGTTSVATKSFYHKWFQGVREQLGEDCFVFSSTSAGGSSTPYKSSRWSHIPQMKAQFPNRFVKGKTGAANSEIVYFDYGSATSPTSKTSKETSSVAPYVLLPGDSLILGVEYLPCMPWEEPSDAECKYLSSSYVTIKAEPASMTMYGSLIKENKEYHETRNQDLTSLSIHEAMHSNPTLDQFEIEPGLMYSGSMLNEYVQGDIFNVGTYAVGRSVSSNASLDSGRTSWSLLRGVKTIDEKERFYDTLLPDMLEYSKTLKDYTDSNGDLWGADYIEVSPTLGEYTHQLAIVHNFSGSSGSAMGAFWPYLNTFPFESFTSRNDAQYRVFYVHPGLLVSAPPGGYPLSVHDVLNNDDSKRFLFMEGVSDLIGAGVMGAQPVLDILGQTGGCYGFKYGVRNITPINTAAVYRHQHYGHFRDMLEQRQFSRFYKKSTGLSNQSIFKYGMQPSQSYITQGPLTVKFVEPNTETITDPMDTFASSNIDNHATSSIPFIDDDNTYNRSFEEIVVP